MERRENTNKILGIINKQRPSANDSITSFVGARTLLILLGLGSFAVNALSSSSAFATYDVSITTGGDISLDTKANTQTIYEDEITVVSSCSSGYNFTIKSSASPELYLGGDSNNNTANTYFNPVDGTSTLSSSNNTNAWGYSLTASSNNGVFSPLSTTEFTIKTNSETAVESGDINDAFSIYYGVNTGDAMTPGSYTMASSGAIIYTVTMDASCANYNIEYNTNYGSVDASLTDAQETEVLAVGESGATFKTATSLEFASPTIGSHTDSNNNTIGTADKLWAFWGWNTKYDGSGDWYKADEDIEFALNDTVTYDDGNGNSGTITIGSNATVHLYAIWKQPTLADLTTSTASGTEKVINHNEMQDMSPAACYNSRYVSSSEYASATLTDDRDGTTRSYTIAKLPDNLCWMTTNLNLGSTSTITLTSDDSDVTSNITLPASSSTFFTGASYYTTAQLYNGESNDGNYSGTYYGGYYSWASAIADKTNAYSSGNVTTSICPKNWDLPTSAQYTTLKSAGSLSNYSTASASPYNFTYGGYKTASGWTSQAARGDLWTSTAYSDSYAHGAYITSSAFAVGGSGTNYYKYYGRSVRCVASQGTATITYDGNGSESYPVTGTTASQEDVEINVATASSNGFTRTGWVFKNWNTAADGSGTAVAVGATFSTIASTLGLYDGVEITLYAQWTPRRNIIYNDNYSDTTDSATWVTAGSSTTLGSMTKFTTKANYVIGSWNTAADGSGTSYAVGASYSVPSSITESDSVTLYAQWVVALTIVYHANYDGSSATLTDTTGAGMNFTTKNYNAWSRAGYRIVSWNTASDFSGTSYAVNTSYTADSNLSEGATLDLYAKWSVIYTIKYSNGGDSSVSGTMSNKTSATATATEITHTNAYEGSRVNLVASNYKKEGYGFAGWAPAPGVDPNNNTNNVPIYGPNETITAPDYDLYGSNNTIYMYPVWVAAETTVTMQTFNATNYANYSSAANGTIVALKDERDNDVYAVAKLADGNWWMIENLRLDDSATITTSNTQSNNGAFGGVFTGLPSSVDTTWSSNTSNNLYSGLTIYTLPQLNTNNTNSSTMGGTGVNASNTSLFDNYNQNNTQVSWYSYGNYYSWAAAMASTVALEGAITETSICPNGWRLPTGHGGGEFSMLDVAMGGTGVHQDTSEASNRWRSFPNNFILSGEYYNSGATSRNTEGWYYSAYQGTNDATSNVVYLRRLHVYPGTYAGYVHHGFSVRCIATS